MTFAGTSWSTFAEAVSRGLRTFGRTSDIAAPADPYERTPLCREDMAALFELENPAPEITEEALRASERHERESLSMIRAALYPNG